MYALCILGISQHFQAQKGTLTTCSHTQKINFNSSFELFKVVFRYKTFYLDLYSVTLDPKMQKKLM